MSSNNTTGSELTELSPKWIMSSNYATMCTVKNRPGEYGINTLSLILSTHSNTSLIMVTLFTYFILTIRFWQDQVKMNRPSYLKYQGAGLNITVEGDVQDFLGVNIERHDDGTITFSQPHLIDKILQTVRLRTEDKNRDTPAATSRIQTQTLRGLT